MKKAFILLMAVAALGMMSCDPKPVQVNPSDDNTVASLKGSDMAVFEDGKMTFYNSSTNAFVPFAAEKEYVVSGVFYDENEFYYTVSVDDELYLKKVDLSAEKPAPVQLIDWELKLSDCYDESCEKCASMVYYSDVEMVGIEYNMGEMCKGFQDMKYYLIDEQIMSDGWPEGVDNGFLMYQDFINNVHFITMPIKEGSEEMRYYYCPEDYGMYSEEELPEHLVCISDKINFHEGKYEGWEGQPEFTFLSINPDDGCIAYAAIMEWGGGRGPLCFATTDGKIQKILAYDAKCGWLEDGRLVFNDDEGIKTVSPDGTIKKLTSGKNFVTSHD
jgi:hypothetical protein